MSLLADFFKIAAAGPTFFVSAWLLMIFAGIADAEVGMTPRSLGVPLAKRLPPRARAVSSPSLAPSSPPARACQHGPVPLLFEDDHQSVPANRSAPQAVGCQGGLMDRPQVIIHNLISLDGRLDGFRADAGLYYELAARLPHQAVLTGSGTMLAAAASEGIDLSEEDPEPLPGIAATGSAAAGDARPLLVIVDGQGRVTRYAWLREQPFWRDVLVLCTAATPAGQLDRLRRHRVGHAVLGEGRVDLGGALRLLAEQHRVGSVRVDAGGGLNGALLRAGLADQLSIVIAPYLAASAIAGPVRLLTGPGCPDAVALDLTAVERLRQGHVWLRYDVRKGPVPGLSRVDPAAKSGFPGGLAGALRLFIPPRRSPC